VDPRHEIEHVVRSMENQLGDKQIQVELNISQEVGLVRADLLRFAQVLTNLLTNACKYSPVGSGVTISAVDTGASV